MQRNAWTRSSSHSLPEGCIKIHNKTQGAQANLQKRWRSDQIGHWKAGIYISRIEWNLRGANNCIFWCFAHGPHKRQNAQLHRFSNIRIQQLDPMVSWWTESTASNSTLQSELIGASTTADKAAWFYYFMESYPFLFGVETAPSIPLFIDNQACLSVTNHPNNTKSRHIALRELVRNKRLSWARNNQALLVSRTLQCCGLLFKIIGEEPVHYKCLQIWSEFCRA